MINERKKAYMLEYRIKNKEILKLKKSIYDQNYKPRRHTQRLKERYGITSDQYDAMLVIQKNVCAICKQKCVTHKWLCVDHDHVTGKVRGLLCSKCNKGLGIFKDSVSILLECVTYLLKNGWGR